MKWCITGIIIGFLAGFIAACLLIRGKKGQDYYFEKETEITRRP